MKSKSRLNLKQLNSFRSNRFSQTNRSVSKQAHAFGRSSRFIKQNPNCMQHFYAVEQIATNRPGAIIGYGKKSDFTKDLACSPGSTRYNLVSQMDQKVAKKKGFSISLGRDKHSFGQYISKQLCRTPSCQKYKINLSVRQRAPAYSMRLKTKQLNKSMSIESQNQNPGPAHYNNPEQNNQSKYSSKFPSIKFSASRSKRFLTTGNQSPGPAAYNSISNLSGVGKYIISQDRGGTLAKIGSSKRITKFDEQIRRSKMVPGAGSYRIPSQFGQYN